MAENNFIIDLIAHLKKSQSKKQVQIDAKNLGDIKVPLIGTLKKAKTRAQIKQDLSSLNGTVNLTGKVDKKGVVTSVRQATQQAQKKVNAQPIEINFSVKKDKLVNDIKLLGRQNSKLFKDAGMSKKYTQLLNSAQLANSTKELNNLRLQLGAFRSELKVTGNAGMTLTDALKSGLSKTLQLFGSYGIIMQFTKHLRNAWTEAKALDTAMTDLSRVNSEITRSGFPNYLDKAISKTKELAVATKDYIDVVTTFSRAGYNLTDSEILSDMSVQLMKVGDMDAESASKALLSGLQGYAEIDGYGMDQLAEKAQALNDKIDVIGNTASITQKEVAEGIQAVGSVMSDANTSVDEFLALLGAANRSVQDSNKVALAIRTSALRIRGCTVELQEMGEETDDVIESTSTLAAKIKALTNIDGGGGVDILEADEETFRSIYDIYNDISKVYSEMSDTDASALLDLIAGKNRSNQISAVLNNMSEANELLNRSLNATGTASEEYQIYLNSAQAATERFGVAMTEAYSNVINGETVKSLTNVGTAVLDFANSFGILEGTLKGFLALGILKGITTLTVAFKNSAVQASNFGTALNTVNKLGSLAAGTSKYAEAMNTLQKSCVGLNDAQLKQILSNSNLNNSEQIKILRYQGLTKAEAQAKLAQMGLTKSTNAQNAANTTATTSTFSLSAAVKGLGANIKTAFLSNPIGVIILGISAAIGVFSSAISKSNQKAEEAIQKTKEAANTFKETSSSIDDYVSKYKELREQLIAAKGNEEETYNVKQQLLELQTELNEKYGDERQRLSLLTDAYKDQTEAIKEFNKESAKKFLNENRESIEKATDKMDKDNSFYLGSMNGVVDAGEIDLLNQIKDIANNNGIDFTDNGFEFAGKANEASESINNFMNEIKELQKQAGDTSDTMSGIFDGILDNSGKALTSADSIIEEYGEIYNQAKMAQIASDTSLSKGYNEAVSAVEAYNEAVLKSEDPYNDENVKKAWDNLRTVKQGIQDNEEEWGQYSNIIDNVFSSANDAAYSFSQVLQNDNSLIKLTDDLKGLSDIDLQAMADDGDIGDSFGELCKAAEKYELEVQDVIDLLVKLGYVQGKIQHSSSNSSLLSFDQAFEQLESDAQKKLLDLAKSGEITPEVLEATEEYTTLITQTGLSAEAARDKILDMLSAQEKLAAASNGLNQLKSSYEEFKDLGFVTASALESLPDSFKRLEGYDLFSEIVGDPTQGEEKIQQAFNSIVKEYIIAQDTLSGLVGASEAQIQSYIANLKEMGVTNAEEVVNNAIEIFSQENELINAAEEEYIKYLYAKDGYDSEYLKSVTSKNSQLAKALGEPYKADYDNWCDLLSKKSEAYNKFVNALKTSQSSSLSGAPLSSYGQAQEILREANGKTPKSVVTSLTDMLSGNNTKDIFGNSNLSAYTKEQIDAAKEYVKSYEEAQRMKEELKLDYSLIDTNFGFNFSPKTSGSKDSSKSKKNEFSKLFDWIETRIEYLSNKASKFAKKATDEAFKYLSNAYKRSNLKKAISYSSKAVTANRQGRDYYEKELKKVGLSETWAAKVRTGTIDMSTITDEALANQIDAYQELYDKMKKCDDAVIDLGNDISSYAESIANIPLDRAESKIEKYEDSLDVLSAKYDILIGSKDKNKNLNEQTVIAKNEKKAYAIAEKQATNYANKLWKSSALKSAMNSSANKKKEKGDTLSTKGLKIGSKEYNAVIKYNKAIEAQAEAIKNAEVSAAEYTKTLRENRKAQFDNIADDYSKKIQLIDYQMTALDNKISEIEASGNKVNHAYYESQKSINDQILSQYKEEKASLEEYIKNIKEGTDEWFDAKDQIQGVADAISECTKKTYEFNNAINQLRFDYYDDISDSISRIITENDFLTDLFEHENMTDSKTGTFTDAGLAKLGTLSSNYYASKGKLANNSRLLSELQDVIKYGKQVDGSYKYGSWEFNSFNDANKKLNEVYDQRREITKEFYDYETKIYDLMKERYQVELDYLKELIDAKKDALQAEKDLHDYQKTISEKTENISTLKKRIAAYSGDTSQEGLAKLQKLQVQLNEAQDDLKETEYDKYISDQEDMLDKLYEEYEELLKKKLEDFMTLVKEGLETSDKNLSSIESFLKNIASENGYTEETKGLFNGLSGSISDNIDRVITAITNQTYQDSGLKDNDGVSKEIANTAPSASQGTPSVSQGTPQSENSSEEQKIRDAQDAKYTKENYRLMASEFISKKAHKATKDKNEYGAVNKAIYENKAKAYKGTGRVLSVEDLRLLSGKLGIDYNGTGKKKNLYKKLHEIGYKGFKKGGIAQLIKDKGEDGLTLARNGEGFIAPEHVKPIQELVDSVPAINKMTESLEELMPAQTELAEKLSDSQSETDNIIRTPDGVELIPINPGDLIRELQARSNNAASDSGNMATPNLQDLSNMIKPNIPDFSNMMKLDLPDVQSVGDMNNVVNIDLGGITMNGVNDPKEFANQVIHSVQKYPKVQKAIHAIESDRLLGGGKLKVHNIR